MSETSSDSTVSGGSEVIRGEARPVRVGSIYSPWHVTTEDFRPANAKTDSTFHDCTRLRLYRGSVEVYAVEYQFLSEIDEAKSALLRVVSVYEGERIRTLALVEALRESGVPEGVVRIVTSAGLSDD